MKILFILMILSSFSYAQISTPPLESQGSEVVPELNRPQESSFEQVVDEAGKVEEHPASDKIEKVKRGALKSRDHRENSLGTVMVGYQLITSWLPSKKTISYTHIFNDKWSLEGEYSWSSVSDPLFWVDIASIKEKRFNLQARRYVGNSFHFSFGAVYSQFSAYLDGDILNNSGDPIRSSFDAQNIGVTGGIGNRWQWGNGVTFGVDWIRLNVPVFETYVRDDVLDSISDNDEEKDVKNIIRTFNRIPTFVLLGLNIGYTF